MSRFWKYVYKGSVDECWLWTGAVNLAGYGNAWLCGGHLNASRAAYIMTYGDIPVGKDVMHLCHNKLCCNPHHLRLGSRSENCLHTGYSGGTIRSTNKSGLTGVASRKRNRYWESYYYKDGQKTFLYSGKDFFEACAARKSWEAHQ